MKATAEMLALEQILTLCRGHDEALNDALVDLSRRELNARALTADASDCQLPVR